MDNDVKNILKQAREAEKSGQLEHSINLLRDASSVRPTDIAILVKLAVLQEKIGDLNDASRIYKSILKIDPSIHGADAGLARIMYETGESSKAIIHIDRAIQLKSTAARWNIKGCILEVLNREVEAEKSFLCAIQIDPHFSESYYNLGVNYKLRGEYDLAIDYLKHAINYDQMYAAAYAELGFIEAKHNNNLVRAEKYIRRSLELVDTSYWPHIYLATILSLTGRVEEAENEKTIADIYR